MCQGKTQSEAKKWAVVVQGLNFQQNPYKIDIEIDLKLATLRQVGALSFGKCNMSRRKKKRPRHLFLCSNSKHGVIFGSSRQDTHI